MRVVATARGYHGVLREVGAVFDVSDKAKASWFKPAPKGADLTSEDSTDPVPPGHVAKPPQQREGISRGEPETLLAAAKQRRDVPSSDEPIV